MILDTARTTLLAPFELEEAKLERIFGTLVARKDAWADAYRHTPHGKPVELKRIVKE